MITLDYMTHSVGHIKKTKLKEYDKKLADIRANFEAREDMLGWYDIEKTITSDQL